MSTTGDAVDALMNELIKVSKRKGGKGGKKPRPRPKGYTRTSIRKLEREL